MKTRGRQWVQWGIEHIVLNTGAYAFYAFFVMGVMRSSVFDRFQGALDALILYGWGMLLCVLRFLRRRKDKCRADMTALTLLVIWAIVPFAFRFGFEAMNVESWLNYIVIYLGLYAVTSDADEKSRGRNLDTAAALFAGFGWILGVILLGCAAYGISATENTWLPGVGIISGHRAALQFGIHYNVTVSFSVSTALMCAAGMARRKTAIGKVYHAVPFAMMVLVSVLTCSRTGRYGLLAAFALAVYLYMVQRLSIRRTVLRHALGIIGGISVAAAGLWMCMNIDVWAIRHYAEMQNSRAIVQEAEVSVSNEAGAVEQESNSLNDAEQSESTSNLADNTEPAEGALNSPDDAEFNGRTAVSLGDASFTGRTELWRSVFRYWKQEPLHLLIGTGTQRAQKALGEFIGQGMLLTPHNSFLHMAMEYGMIGFLLLMTALAVNVPKALRVCYAPRHTYTAGMHAMILMIVFALIDGLMESMTFEAMHGLNVVFVFALAMINAEGRMIGKKEG